MIFKSLQIENFIKKSDEKVKAILVYGTNDGLVLDTIKRIAKSVCKDLNDAFQVADLSGESVLDDFGKLYAEYNGQSLMGGRRVIIVREISNQLTKDVRKMLDESKSDNLLLIVTIALRGFSRSMDIKQILRIILPKKGSLKLDALETNAGFHRFNICQVIIGSKLDLWLLTKRSFFVSVGIFSIPLT